ncbi:MAG: hypothetical protein QOG64_1526, partial [Acidimicrobiaceae bacterium]|nr:hypothetical protein [Acidimicrobiaceae bacterium]
VAPGFASASEPFVLLEGPAMASTGRFARPARGDNARCPVVVTTASDLVRLRRDVEHSRTGPDPLIDPAADGETDWYPIMFDWEVEWFPLAAPDDGEYPSDHLAANYQFEPGDVDLLHEPDRSTAAVPDLFSGRSLLTRGAVVHATEALELFIWRQLVRDRFWAPDDAPPDDQRSSFIADRSDAIAQYAQTVGGDNGIVATALRTLVALRATAMMGQVLSGFNAALLMQRQAAQVPVADPIGFADHQAFTADVADAVGTAGRFAPIGVGRFHPLRAGDISLLRLRVIDSFGRHIDYDRDTDRDSVLFNLSRHYRRQPREPSRVHLPARLSQPARLATNWLSAATDEIESSDHPVTSPICGWLMPNPLARSVMIYTADGDFAGSLLTGPDRLDPRQAKWLPAPGNDRWRDPARLANRHLRTAVARLRALGPEELGQRLEEIGRTLDMIEPHAADDHPELAFLMGQPMALVLGRIDLQVLGRTAIDQSWAALATTLAAAPDEARPDRNFAAVEIGVRLGASSKLDDGLVGYWIEGDDGIGSDQLQPVEGGALTMTVAGGPVTVAMLIDPRAPVHIRCGLLPAQTMSVPAEHTRAAIGRLAVSFPVAPLLSPAERVHLAVSHEPGFRWAWIEREGAVWSETRENDLAANVPAPIDDRQILRDGWLRLAPEPVE